MDYNRAIKYALDKTTGEIICADDIFDDRLIGFEVRKKYNRDELNPFCLECGNSYSVSSSKYERIHFKHNPTNEYCILKDEKLSPKTREDFYNIYKSKESERHKFLKNRIGQTISNINGISDISIDNKFIFSTEDKRRPDVYCKYFNKEIVFEIQLSNLSQRYILSRFDFYRKKGIYLIWILDNFDVKGQSQMEKDIKYLSNHQNFFKLDEEAKEFKLLCTYKFTFLSNENKYMDKWNEVSIDLDKLKFDNENFEVFFYNFGNEKEMILELQRSNEIRRRREILENEIEAQKIKDKKEKEDKARRIDNKINEVLDEIKRLKSKRIATYKDVIEDIRQFEDYEMEALNKKLNLNQNNALKRWFSEDKLVDFSFLNFILECHFIEYDINLKRDNEGNRIIDYVFKNEEITQKEWFLRLLIKRGHKFLNNDESYVNSLYPNESHKAHRFITLAYLANKLENESFIKYVFKFDMVVCIIESARQNKIIGYKYKPNEWINFANNAIENYPKYWEYIEVAFKHFGLFEKLINLDINGTFRNKLMNFYSKENKSDYSFDYLFGALYPEIGRINKL